MSSGLQNKMYNLEVAPPAGVWEKIAVELDESELSSKFSSKLYNAAAIPPSHLWQRIVTTLDESLLVDDYSSKLYGVEVAPPGAAWNKIKTSLEEEEGIPVPEVRRLSPLYKYAVAAIIIGLMVWSGIRFLDNKPTDTAVAGQKTLQPKKNTVTPQTTPVETAPVESVAATSSIDLTDEARNDAALEASKKTFAKLDIPAAHSKIKNAANFYFASPSYVAGNIGDPGTAPDSDEVKSTDISNRYILLMTPDGNIIRMSKKLGGMVCCVSGAEQDENCKDQMKKWREKIACSNTAHAPGNFMDILSLVSSLQDN
jgi:hypothetical protein